MLGLRVSEACGADVTDLRYDSGYELLTIMGKDHKPAQIPLPVPVQRAVHEATADRKAGPLLLNRAGARMTPAAAAGNGSAASSRQSGSNTLSAPTACAARSAPPAWSRASRYATCSTPCDTATPAPPCSTT